MATIDQILAGMIDFRDEVYSRLDSIQLKLDNIEFINYHVCTMCHGAKEIIPSYNLNENPPFPITCPSCNGEGHIPIGISIEKD